jgi:hypothetical protein
MTEGGTGATAKALECQNPDSIQMIPGIITYKNLCLYVLFADLALFSIPFW